MDAMDGGRWTVVRGDGESIPVGSWRMIMRMRVRGFGLPLCAALWFKSRPHE
jgi:hypothetical protein